MYDAEQGRAWTADEIGDRLKNALAESFGVRLSAASRGAYVDAATGRRLRPSDFIRAIQQLLGRSEECEMLLAWARSQAGIGCSLRETCRIKGWAVSTVEYRRKRACRKLSALLESMAFAERASQVGSNSLSHFAKSGRRSTRRRLCPIVS